MEFCRIFVTSLNTGPHGSENFKSANLPTNRIRITSNMPTMFCSIVHEKVLFHLLSKFIRLSEWEGAMETNIYIHVKSYIGIIRRPLSYGVA